MKLLPSHWTNALLCGALLTACVPALLENHRTADSVRTASVAKDWTTEYQNAMSDLARDPSSSCAEFAKLSDPSKSPIAPLASAREFQYCSSGNETNAVAGLRKLDADSHLNWLKPLIAEAVVELAQRAHLDEALASYAIARSKDLNSQREKETLLSAALSAARSKQLSTLVQSLETELYRISPRLEPNPAPANWLKAADDFRINSDWPNAISLYTKITKNGQGGLIEHYKALDGIRQVQKAKFRNEGGALQDFLDSSKTLSRWSQQALATARGLSGDDAGSLLQGWMQYARDNWSYGDVKVAQQEIQALLALGWPSPLFRAYAYWLDGRIHANYGEWGPASESGGQSAQILASEVKNSSSWGKWQWQLWDDSLWGAAFAARKLHDWQRSASLLNQALEHSTNATNKLKFSFWLAENLKDAGQSSQAHDAFAHLAELDPYDFYGFLGMLENGVQLSPLPDLNLEEAKRPASVSQEDFDALVWLNNAGELSLGQKYSRAILPAKSVQIDELLLRAYLKDFSRIWDLSYLIDPSQRISWTAKYARLLYPQPYLDLVQNAVQRFPAVDKEYVYSIMRQESGFDTTSLSPAYAYGLLQLLPGAAKSMENKAGVTFEHDYDLFTPAINIPLGVALMDTLVNQTNNSFILRTGAYNSALSKMVDWRNNLYKGNVFEFLEEIPYDETRAYVRLVMRNYLMNHRLDTRDSFAFPTELLKL
jgi:soluble lytic murein transglycosylase